MTAIESDLAAEQANADAGSDDEQSVAGSSLGFSAAWQDMVGSLS